MNIDRDKFELDPTDSSEVNELFNLTLEKAELKEIDENYQERHKKWLRSIQNEDKYKIKDLISLVGLLGTRDIDKQGHIKETKQMSRELKASREAILAEIDRRNTEKITDTMNKLDEQASVLDKKANLIGTIAVILATIQLVSGIVIPLWKNQNLYKSNKKVERKIIVELNL